MNLDKSQADGIQAELAELSKTSGQNIGVQVSTVDAFQVCKAPVTNSIIHRELD